MIKKQDGRHSVGALGCGWVAGFTHLEFSVKAVNACLCAIRNSGRDLLAGIAVTYELQRSFSDHDPMYCLAGIAS